MRNRDLETAADIAQKRGYSHTLHILSTFFKAKVTVKRLLTEIETDYAAEALARKALEPPEEEASVVGSTTPGDEASAAGVNGGGKGKPGKKKKKKEKSKEKPLKKP